MMWLIFLLGMTLGAEIMFIVFDYFLYQPMVKCAQEGSNGWAKTIKDYADLLVKFNEFRLNMPVKSPIQKV